MSSKLQHFLAKSGVQLQETAMLPQDLASAIQTSGKNTIVVVKDAMADAAARLNLKIVRLTNNIDATLPAPMFGAHDKVSDWVEAISDRLPAGCTVAVDRTTDKKGVKVSFTVGGQTDVIEMTCKNKPYISLLESTKTTKIVFNEIKMKLNSTDNEEQFAEEILPYRNALFGKKTSDGFTADDFENEDGTKTNIRTITRRIEIDGYDTLIFDMLPIANNAINMAAKVEYFNLAV